jgi:F-type H+-transporting ATPase subunit epsilon
MKTISVEIITPEKVVLKDDARYLVLPAARGDMGVLPGHMRLLTILKPGKIRIEKDSGRQIFLVKSGFAQVQPDSVRIFADGLVPEDEKTGAGAG